MKFPKFPNTYEEFIKVDQDLSYIGKVVIDGSITVASILASVGENKWNLKYALDEMPKELNELIHLGINAQTMLLNGDTLHDIGTYIINQPIFKEIYEEEWAGFTYEQTFANSEQTWEQLESINETIGTVGVMKKILH